MMFIAVLVKSINIYSMLLCQKVNLAQSLTFKLPRQWASN